MALADIGAFCVRWRALIELPMNEGEFAPVSLISRLFASRSSGRPHSRDALRPLWDSVVAIGREREWYASLGIADTVSGRFDAITLVLSLVMLRMERGVQTEHLAGGAKAPLVDASARLTELFVEDMDGQLRQSGVGDLVVGKRMGKLVSVLGGRIGALREALDDGADEAALPCALERNTTLVDGADPVALAIAVRHLHTRFQALGDDAILSGEIGQ